MFVFASTPHPANFYFPLTWTYTSAEVITAHLRDPIYKLHLTHSPTSSLQFESSGSFLGQPQTLEFLLATQIMLGEKKPKQTLKAQAKCKMMTLDQPLFLIVVFKSTLNRWRERMSCSVQQAAPFTSLSMVRSLLSWDHCTFLALLYYPV